jgi:hypothetical protein
MPGARPGHLLEESVLISGLTRSVALAVASAFCSRCDVLQHTRPPHSSAVTDHVARRPADKRTFDATLSIRRYGLRR